MSLVSTPSTACRSPSACMIAKSSGYAYFLEKVVGRSEMKMLKRRRARTDPCWYAVLKAWLPAPFAISSGKGKAAIANHLHGHVDHVSIRQQSQQLVGEAVVPYSIIDCCEVDKHSSVLLSRKAILDVLCQQGELVYGQPPCRKPTCFCGSSGSMIGSARA